MTRLFCGLLAVWGCLAALTAPAAGQSVIPDARLDAIVRKYVFEKRNNEEPLTADDLKTLSTIQGDATGVKSLDGLEHCHALLLLDLHGGQISDLQPLAELTDLQSLTLANNKISDINPLAKLTSLQYLQLAGNQVEDISVVAGFENLRTLDLTDNRVKDLKPLAKATKVWSLYLDGNQVSDLTPLSSLTWLSTLGLSRNQVKDLAPLQGSSEWKYLFLQENKIANLGELLKMAEADAAGPQRFAPFWRIYLAGNPLSDEAQQKQAEAIRKLGGRVLLEDPKK
ncbi:leucine-rich repeat domain-containing protein [Lignipirellula cremea]|uniref:Internalin-A n=1 Tax=Lignipirellula cremea TaxID=2528010 RepID=A0A518E3T8_9BACT|nr:leucine-rich repeat domain-containing protein [Lignipirellula cremea]QDU98754.1 Internalin-A precursor [Lignipirellula cremea]